MRMTIGMRMIKSMMMIRMRRATWMITRKRAMIRMKTMIGMISSIDDESCVQICDQITPDLPTNCKYDMTYLQAFYFS